MSFDEVLSEAQNYLITIAKYTPEQATKLTLVCNENEFKDVDDLIDDFNGTFEECALIDDNIFISIFPDIKDRKKLFIDIQYALKTKETPSNPVIDIENKETELMYSNSKYRYDEIINMDVSQINDNDLQLIKKLYSKQARQLLSKSDDKTFYQILTLGRLLDMPLMQNLADTYSRMKINGHIKNFDEFKQHYKLLKELKFKQTVRTLAMAPASFHARGLPETQFNPLIKIDDDLYHFYQYGKSCITFIQNLVSSSESEIAPLTPFQVDFWLIPKQSGPDMIEDDDSDDDTDEDTDTDTEQDESDDDMMNERDFNVLELLQHECLIYKSRRVKDSEMDGRLMRDEYKEFIMDLKAKTNNKNAPQFERFNMILDRRKRKRNVENENENENDEKKEEMMDDFYIYKLMEDKFDFRSDGGHVPEIYIANTKKCTLPKKGYCAADNAVDKGLLTYSACDQLNGSNFILSFHVEAIDNIKCYVYYNGTCVRFFPEDMVNIWPNWFKKSDANDKFVEKRELYLKQLDKINIRDDKFEKWYRWSTGMDDLHKGPPKKN